MCLHIYVYSMYYLERGTYIAFGHLVQRHSQCRVFSLILAQGRRSVCWDFSSLRARAVPRYRKLNKKANLLYDHSTKRRVKFVLITNTWWKFRGPGAEKGLPITTAGCCRSHRCRRKENRTTPCALFSGTKIRAAAATTKSNKMPVHSGRSSGERGCHSKKNAHAFLWFKLAYFRWFNSSPRCRPGVIFSDRGPGVKVKHR